MNYFGTDMTKVKGDSSGFDALPAGYYVLQCNKTEIGQNEKSGNSYVRYEWKVVNGPDMGDDAVNRVASDFVPLTQGWMAKHKAIVAACLGGEAAADDEARKHGGNLAPEMAHGRQVVCKLSVREHNGKKQNDFNDYEPVTMAAERLQRSSGFGAQPGAAAPTGLAPVMAPPGAPMTTPPAMPAPAPIGRTFFVQDANSPGGFREAPEAEVVTMLGSGYNGQLALKGENVWKPSNSFGLSTGAPPAPPMQATPGAPPPPPSSVG